MQTRVDQSRDVRAIAIIMCKSKLVLVHLKTRSFYTAEHLVQDRGASSDGKHVIHCLGSQCSKPHSSRKLLHISCLGRFIGHLGCVWIVALSYPTNILVMTKNTFFVWNMAKFFWHVNAVLATLIHFSGQC